jgi:ketosteroid isomerase-like protein
MPKNPSASAFVFAFLLAIGSPSCAAENVPDLLRRQAQELVDAIPPGSAAVWDRYLDENVRFVDESGKVSTKKQMVEDIKPMPEGVSGSIKITEFDAAVHGNVAVATYIDDENEDYHGHKLHCQYRTTDTWIKTAKGWRLIASQVLALRTDPPSVPLTAALLDEYCGRYALTPAIAYEIRGNGVALEGQQTGRKAEELRAEAPDVLFVPGRPRYRYVFLRDADGKITGLAQRREAWDLVWRATASDPKSR